MRSCRRYLLMITTLLVWPALPLLARPADSNAPAPAVAPVEPPAAPAAAAGAGGDAQEATLWRSLRRIQRMVPPSKRSPPRPFASVAVPGKAGGPRAELVHQDETGNAFRIAAVTYTLDGYDLGTQKSSPDQILAPQLQVFEGRIRPGNHTLGVRLVMRGHGYGIFSYMKSYRVDYETSRKFRVSNDGTSRVTIRIRERATENLQERFYVTVDSKQVPHRSRK